MKASRKQLRLKHYDYTESGVYFVTVCSRNRECLFGDIVGATGRSPALQLNAYGNIVRDEWLKSAVIRNEITLDAFVVMPNHIHGIIFIIRATGRSPLHDTMKPGLRSRSLGAFMAGFKSSTTKQINIMRTTPGIPVWQRNYYEHVIRTDDELNKTREYIINNPMQWELDEENPLHARSVLQNASAGFRHAYGSE